MLRASVVVRLDMRMRLRRLSRRIRFVAGGRDDWFFWMQELVGENGRWMGGLLNISAIRFVWGFTIP